VPFNRIAIDVIQMMLVIDSIANPMIGESPLPDFLIAADDCPEFMRVRSFNRLDCPLDRYVVPRSQEQMHVFGHDDEGMQVVSPLTTIPIERFQEDSTIYLDREQFSATKRREGDKISSRRREQSSRLQEQTSAAGSRLPFPVVFHPRVLVLGNIQLKIMMVR
jgi:hypothetical protein